MKTEKIGPFCPRCLAALPMGVPEELCPNCLRGEPVNRIGSVPSPAGAPILPSLEAVISAFPQFEINELIGHGGMGVVYKARQPKLDRFAALKILPESLALDSNFASRFSREARVLARLNHPGIVTVYDFGQSAGFYFVLMEYMNGTNLRQALQARRFTPEETLRLMPTICDALAYAHNEGVLHRDIKPENILLDARGRIKVADFGIAKLIGEGRDGVTLTRSDVAVGTPHYMAPEQLEHPEAVDQRADIYSLGVVFYEMLTGELPIGRFAPPSQKSGGNPRLDAIVLRALEKDKENRYSTASELKASIEGLIMGSTEVVAGHSAIVQERRASCFLSNQARMQNCFSNPRAHIFQCKGELRLTGENLIFISPWQTQIVISLREIQNVSVGQFQMWKTLRMMKCSRIFFIAIAFGHPGHERTVYLTPFSEGAASAGAVNTQVADWCNAIRGAVYRATGLNPAASEPTLLSVSAHRSWFRVAGPFIIFAPLAAWLVGIVNIRSPFGPAPLAPWLGTLVLLCFLLIRLGWFVQGFFRANDALASGRLDEVTSDEPMDSGLGGDAVAEPEGSEKPGKLERPFWCTVAGWVFLIIGLWALVETLAGIYSRAVNQTFYPGIAHAFVGIALLTLSRRWRFVALVALAVTLVCGAFICTMLIISPEHGAIIVPATDLNLRPTEYPRLAATATVFPAFGLGLPFYLLMCSKGKALFGIKSRGKH